MIDITLHGFTHIIIHYFRMYIHDANIQICIHTHHTYKLMQNWGLDKFILYNINYVTFRKFFN